jgi:ferredoxin
MKLLFLYFSGTGNTDYVAHYLARKLAHLPVEIELRTIEQQPPEALTDFDLLAVGFPVYAVDAPIFFQEYLHRLPQGGGRGAFVFCTKGAWAGSAVRRMLQRLALQGYVPLGGDAVGMPGTDGLSMVGKDSWLARTALEKDYDHLKDGDRLAEKMESAVAQLLDGSPVEALRQPLPSQIKTSLSGRAWARVYKLSEDWALARFYADDRCEGCGLCARLCPVDNVELREGHAWFADCCVLCLRCLHACPQEAIQIGKLTVNKFRWKGPKGDFRPLRMRGMDGVANPLTANPQHPRPTEKPNPE